MTDLRVVSLPSDHPYVRAVQPGAGVSAVAPESRAVPHPLWEAAALEELAEVDLVHVHFGFDHLDVAAMRAWTATVRSLRLALVVTVHDLRNPHHLAPDLHDAHLAALLEEADVVLTLTHGAAGEIAERFGRVARVVSHPSLVTSARPFVPPRRVAGVHLKSLRTNVIEPDRLIRSAAAGAHDAGSILQVDVHSDSVDDPRLTETRSLALDGCVDLRVHGRLTDDALTTYLAGLHASVLPYRFGTHSGWLELCRDLGTRVVAPDCGYYADQWSDVVTFRWSERGADDGTLRGAVSSALLRSRPAPADPRVRAGELDAVRHAHLDAYRDALRSRAARA